METEGKIMNALGMIETRGLVASIEAADAISPLPLTTLSTSTRSCTDEVAR